MFNGIYRCLSAERSELEDNSIQITGIPDQHDKKPYRAEMNDNFKT